MGLSFLAESPTFLALCQKSGKYWDIAEFGAVVRLRYRYVQVNEPRMQFSLLRAVAGTAPIFRLSEHYSSAFSMTEHGTRVRAE